MTTASILYSIESHAAAQLAQSLNLPYPGHSQPTNIIVDAADIQEAEDRIHALSESEGGTVKIHGLTKSRKPDDYTSVC